MGAISTETRCVDGVSKTIEFGYDELGRLERMGYPGGDEVIYDFDNSGQVSSVSGIVSRRSYDAAGRLTGMDLPNGVKSRWTYSRTRGWLERERVTRGRRVIFDGRYGYGPTGLVRTVRGTGPPLDLDYNDLQRLTSVSGTPAQSFDFEGDGRMRFNSALGNYTYPPPGPRGCSTAGQSHQCPHPHAVRSAGDLTFRYQWREGGRSQSWIAGQE